MVSASATKTAISSLKKKKVSRKNEEKYAKNMKLGFKLPMKYLIDGEASFEMQQKQMADNRRRNSDERAARILERENVKNSQERAQAKERKNKPPRRTPVAPVSQGEPELPKKVCNCDGKKNMVNPFSKFSEYSWEVILHDAVEAGLVWK